MAAIDRDIDAGRFNRDVFQRLRLRALQRALLAIEHV